LGFKSRSEAIEIVASILSLVGLSHVSQLVYKNILAMADVKETYIPRVPAISFDIFLYLLPLQTGSGAHPASYQMGTWGSFPGGKARPGREADHSPPSSDEVKND
jgi:hypothetical protein